MVFIPPSRAEIDNAARDAVVTLRAVCGASATFFFVGSFACKLYGDHVSPYMTFRSPNDIDIVVETQMDQEELKRRMVQHNSRFFLVAAKIPGATYKVLKHGLTFSRYAVKVDVLIANVTLDIPTVPSSRVKSIDAYPTCPLAFLILLRLQAWDHHRVAALMHLRNKAAVDYSDLTIHLLPYARSRLGASMMSDAETYLPERFMRISKARVQRFVDAYPSSRPAWEKVGAKTDPPADTDALTRRLNRLALYR